MGTDIHSGFKEPTQKYFVALRFPVKILFAFLAPHSCYTPRHTHPHWSDYQRYLVTGTNHKTFFLSFYFRLSFLVWPLLPTHCKCRGLLLDMITLNDTHSVWLLWTRDRVAAETSTWHTTLTTDGHPRPRRDSNPQSQHASGPRTTPYTTRLPVSTMKLLIVQLHIQC
jgi:hypothetical protein